MSNTDASKWYLAGPMTGVPQFNLPTFVQAAAELRSIHGLDVVSPAELDDEETARISMDSADGLDRRITSSWGALLARDIKMVADLCTGVVFLDGWEKSRGARLEAFVGILCGHDFARYVRGHGIERISAPAVLTAIARATYTEMRNG